MKKKPNPIIVNDSICTENFSASYPFINKHLVENGETEDSRNGATKEVLDFKTTLTNPYRRCVGNNDRNINIFFLLAEALWIFAGKKDVATLKLFNDQMGEYSDDGVNFHAPYGFRLRHLGVSSFDNPKATSPENNAHAIHQENEGEDQILDALTLLSQDSQSRRVVMQIWNSALDLNKKSKDLPCNDLILLKIRNGKMIVTIANRSNDLHWGLPTNIFQFSFMSEIMSLILGVELGTQTHNSQSLHFYTENDIAMRMYENLQFNASKFTDVYDVSQYEKIKINFDGLNNVEDKLSFVDFIFNKILNSLTNRKRLVGHELDAVYDTSEYLGGVHDICHIYLDYKFGEFKDDGARLEAMRAIHGLVINSGKNLDIYALAQNFFYVRLKTDDAKLEASNYIFTKEKL